MTSPLAPIGVFDSGIGGLSVLQALRHELPHEHFVYLADSACAPYGEKGDAFVQARTQAIAEHLRATHGIKALVIACNTATTAAARPLRSAMPDLPIIGVEPAIKPAAQCSQTHHVGVLATRGTVRSQRFADLLQTHGEAAHFHVAACDGLAHAIEQSTAVDGLTSTQTPEVLTLCQQFISALGDFGLKTGEMDTLVLGCTHYIFVKDVLRELVGPDVQVIDTGAAVARQTRRVLHERELLAPEHSLAAVAAMTSRTAPAAPWLFTTGALPALQSASARWLELPASTCATVALPHPQSASLTAGA